MSLSDSLRQNLSFSSREAGDIPQWRLQTGDSPWVNPGAVDSTEEQYCGNLVLYVSPLSQKPRICIMLIPLSLQFAFARLTDCFLHSHVGCFHII